jgi:hypothetical protein
MNEKYEGIVLKLRDAGKESFLFGDLMRNAANAIEELWQMFHSAEMDNIKLTNMYAEQVQKNKRIPATDVVLGESYRELADQVNTLADKLIKIREVAGCRNG